MAKYGAEQISKELSRTSQGDAYYGNALYIARDIPGISHDDRLVLSRWLNGNQTSGDRFALQDIAIKISKDINK